MMLHDPDYWTQYTVGLPELSDLSDFSAEELRSEGLDPDMVLRGSIDVTTLLHFETPIAIVGIVPGPTILADEFMWMLVYKSLGKQHMRGLKRALVEWQKRHPNLTTAVRDSFAPGKRFVEFFGFTPHEQFELFKTDYTIYRKRL